MSDETLYIRAHFDGKVIVPDEPLHLPANMPLNVEVRPLITSIPSDGAAVALRLAALKRFVAGGVAGASISGDALRREDLYGDNER